MTISVLLADDHAVLRDGLRALLEAEPDIEVIAQAENGVEAMRLATERCPDIAILDVAMPELDGIAASQQISAACPKTQIIILSMHHSAEHVTRALQAGISGYLVKASAGREVVEAVRIVHSGKHYMSRKISQLLVDGYLGRAGEDVVPDPLIKLSAQEREVMLLLLEGKSNGDIADILSLSPNTVKSYRSRIMHKLELERFPDLIKFGIRHGLTSLD